MSEELERALRARLDEGLTAAGGGLELAPKTAGELSAVLELLRAHQATFGGRLRLSVRRFQDLGEIQEQSALVSAGAGVLLSRVEAHAQRVGLSLGPLSPEIGRLTVGEFLQGPWAGLRGVRSGRLEPVAIALTAMMADGRLYLSQPVPRSAAGPDLDSLFLGARGLAGPILLATLRLLPLATAARVATWSFSTAMALTTAVIGALQDGVVLERVVLERRDDRFLLEGRLLGSPDSVERDLVSLTHRVLAARGRGAGHHVSGPVEAAPGEREVSWDEVRSRLERGERLTLYRLTVDAVLAALPEGGAVTPVWSEAPVWRSILAAVDSERIWGGAP